MRKQSQSRPPHLRSCKNSGCALIVPHLVESPGCTSKKEHEMSRHELIVARQQACIDAARGSVKGRRAMTQGVAKAKAKRETRGGAKHVPVCKDKLCPASWRHHGIGQSGCHRIPGLPSVSPAAAMRERNSQRNSRSKEPLRDGRCADCIRKDRVSCTHTDMPRNSRSKNKSGPSVEQQLQELKAAVIEFLTADKRVHGPGMVPDRAKNCPFRARLERARRRLQRLIKS